MNGSTDLPREFRLHYDEGGTVRVDGPLGSEAATVHRYVLAEAALGDQFAQVPWDRLADIVDIAQACYIADRLCQRGGSTTLFRWTRQLDVSIPVREPEFWRRDTVVEQLRSTLSYFTQDIWRFEFRPYRRPRTSDRQLPLLDVHEPVSAVSLFSGGLDSLAGIAHEMCDRNAGTHMPFTIATGRRLQHVQEELLHSLNQVDRRVLLGQPLPIGFLRRSTRAERFEEKTQRSRGFVFATLGSVAAILSGVSELRIHENGVGAINLPCTPAQLSCHLTRSTHPVGLRKLSRLISAVAETTFIIRLPNVFRTKADICSALAPSPMARLAGVTVSCDGYPQRVPETPQCGVCTSCLMRRQALHVAGMSHIEIKYRHDVLGDFTRIPPRKLFPLRATLRQIARLRRCLQSAEPFVALSTDFPELLEVALSDDSEAFFSWPEDHIVSMYRRYVSEWDAMPLPEQLRTAGIAGA